MPTFQELQAKQATEDRVALKRRRNRLFLYFLYIPAIVLFLAHVAYKFWDW